MKDEMMEAPEASPLDDIISKVESYIQDPKMATSETLGELKADLIDLKSVIDEEEKPEGMDEDMGKDRDGGLAIMIGRNK